MYYLVCIWPFCLIASRSLAGNRTEVNRYLGTTGSHATIMTQSHTHYIYISDNPGTNTDITTWIDTSPHSVEIIPNLTYRPISDWLGVVNYRARSTRGRQGRIPVPECPFYISR